MTRLQKLRPYLIFFTGSFLFMTFYCFLLQDFVSDFFEDLFDIDDIGYGAIAFIILLTIYLLWSVVGGILYYKLTHRIILSNLASFAGYLTSLIICEFSSCLLNPTHGVLLWELFVEQIFGALLLSILPLLVSLVTMLLSKLSEGNESEQQKEQEEKEVL